MEKKRFREILNSFAESDYNLIVIFNPSCKEETQRIILFTSYEIPRPGITNFSIKGKDITDLVDSLRNNSFEIPGKMDLGLGMKIEQISSYTYLFGQDYSFEVIRR